MPPRRFGTAVPSELARLTLQLRTKIKLIDDAISDADDLLSELETAAGLVDPETGARFDETYNGHPNYEHWNVALWLGNDEGLNTRARHYYLTARRAGDGPAEAARLFLLDPTSPDRTPDGVTYTIERVEAAIRGLVSSWD